MVKNNSYNHRNKLKNFFIKTNHISLFQYTKAMHGLNATSTSNNYSVLSAGKIIQQDSKAVLRNLLSTVKECQTRYGGKTELATENDPRFIHLTFTS